MDENKILELVEKACPTDTGIRQLIAIREVILEAHRLGKQEGLEEAAKIVEGRGYDVDGYRAIDPKITAKSIREKIK